MPDHQSEIRALPPGDPTGSVVRQPRVPTRRLPRPIVSSFQQHDRHFWDYCRVVVRHRWVALSCFLAAVGLAGTYCWMVQPTYTATTTLRVIREEPRVLKFEEVVRSDGDDYQTQLLTYQNLLRSRKLARRVIAELGLEQKPEFAHIDNRAWWHSVERWNLGGFAAPEADEEAADSGKQTPWISRAFERRLNVELVRNARLLNVSFDSHDPQLAARVANTLGQTFVLQTLEEKGEATRYASNFLSGQLVEARQKLDTAENKLSRFLASNNIVFIGTDQAGNRQDLATQQLTVISDALIKARNERIAKESLISQALRQKADSVPVILQSPLIGKLKEELVNFEGEYRKLSLQFRPEYPRLQRLGETIGEVRRQMQDEMTRLVGGLEADYRAALRSEQELQKAMDAHRGLTRRLGDQMAEYNSLRREVDSSRDLFASLMTRLKETQIASSLVTSNIFIADPADVPVTPTKPRRVFLLVVAGSLGLIGGVVLAFVVDYLDPNIKDFRELQETTRLPTFGFVPSQAVLEGRRPSRGDGDTGPFALVAHTESGSVVAEAFRKLRTSLLWPAGGQPPQTILITSLQAADGKTSLASNLAITLAQLGNGEVLLLDCDLRRPEVHGIFKVPVAPGLASVLVSGRDVHSVTRRTDIRNLSILPAGERVRNPAELLASPRFGQVVADLRQRFAHIVIDGSPLFAVSDAMILAPQVDGVLLVLRHGRATRGAAQDAVRLLQSVPANLIGIVLNDVDGRIARAGYGQYSYFGYSTYREAG
jgi:polysaccharide biosynthesis transport protein